MVTDPSGEIIPTKEFVKVIVPVPTLWVLTVTAVSSSVVAAASSALE